ncbi:hypothetical protein Tco_1120356, partial [Tanacetum coccineum]
CTRCNYGAPQADVAGAESEAGEVDSRLKRKRATSDDGVGTSKRVRHVSLGGSTSTEEETLDAPPTLAAKDVTETPPPSNVEAASDSSAPVTHTVQSLPQTSPKAFEGDQDYPIDVIMAGLTLARHATEGAEAQPDYFLKPDVAQLQVPIFARPRDILNPFALEKEILLKESLEAHAIRLAKKKGVKGKAILCGVGAAYIPRSDGVPVSVATVSEKDSKLLGRLEEAGDAAYQVGSSERSRCHSI